MKKITARFFAALLAALMLLLPLAACDSGDGPTVTTDAPATDAPAALPSVYSPTYDVIKTADDAFVASLWAETQAKIDAILSTESDVKPAEGGTVYYVSSLNGNDKNDGLTPETAWKTLERVTVKQRKTIVAGDVVAFERGSVFYTYTDDGYAAFTAKSGVTYTAYGEGEKPIISAAMGDTADPSYWTEVEGMPGVWTTKRHIDDKDIGSIVFNGGESVGAFHSIEYYDETLSGATGNAQTGLSFAGPQDLSFDGQFYFYFKSGMTAGELYLYCAQGNPGEVYDSIHFCRDLMVINASDTENVVIDNLSIRYTGAHGIIANNSKNFTVQNCEIAYIGGSVQSSYNPDSDSGRWDTRYGNGVEVYGSCEGFYVRNNYFTNIYDEAFTTQYNGRVPMLDVRYTGNVVLYARQAASLWGVSELSTLEYSDNHCWYSSCGNPASLHPFYGEDGGAIDFRIDSLGENVEFIMKNNVTAFAGAFLADMPLGYESFVFENNLYLAADTSYLGINNTPYHWDDSAVEAMKTLAHDETAEMYVYMTDSYASLRQDDGSVSVPADVKAGDVVQFGAYEQDNDAQNGAEWIEWIVLDVKDGKALLLSRYVLEAGHYYPAKDTLSWGSSSVRELLEGKFLSRAFTVEEAAKLVTVSVKLEKNEKYTDYPVDSEALSRVFILSAEELLSYLGEDGLKAEPTAYVLGLEGFSLDVPAKDGGASYWTRNYGKKYSFGGVITWEGMVDAYGAWFWPASCRGIRPAVWVTVG